METTFPRYFKDPDPSSDKRGRQVPDYEKHKKVIAEKWEKANKKLNPVLFATAVGEYTKCYGIWMSKFNTELELK